ncbi:serine/threonine protein kinase [Archangium lansingense]|uniref:non-specific serine/threonine protein kinase n=1 Tax=Archangium lansingense TaxID=2995310 RepID=A0ABT3ZXG7_9BACT|nr:serine/threonine-protein kinase [Archangium lansinium]MCY1073744.1 protein kinase [Archangium lansinium]
MEPAQTRSLRPEALPTDTQVGHWRVVERLGVGGYGAAYQVEDIHHPGVILALKLALRAGDARAEREVVLLMDKAVHPNVVRIHGHGRWPDPVEGHTWHVMDLVRGLSLDVWAETLNPAFLQFAETGAKMALTLGELHTRGVVHRDVKPGNILIRELDGEPVLVDFGIGSYEGAEPLTPAPLPPGTPHLRSPEAMRFWLERGKQAGEPYKVGAADDLYALGVSLYRAATGHYPFKPELGDFLPVAIACQRAPVPRKVNRRMPRALSNVLMRMLAKDPKERYRNGAEVHDALMAAAAFGERSQWEASLFEWEETPAAREGEAPQRRIRRPDLPTRMETPPAPAVRLAEGGHHSKRVRRGQAEAATAQQRPKRSLARQWKLLGVALGLCLTVATVYGFGEEPDVKPARAVGHEMARAPESSETGSAAAPLLPESTPAAVASRATPSEDEPPVKAKQQKKSPTPPKSPQPARAGTKMLRDLCVGAAAMTNIACAGAQVAKAPGPEDCPPGAMEAMTQTLGDLFRYRNPLNWKGTAIRLTEGDGRWIPVQEGDTSILLSGRWGKLPPNTVLTGKMYFAEGRAYARLTRAWTPQGTSFPICAELWEPTVRGLELRPGRTRGESEAFSTNIIAHPVRHFD